MRIAYICTDPGVPVFGRKGSSVHVQEVIRAFRCRGAEVVLIARRTGGEPPSDLRDLPVHVLPSLPKGDTAARERAALSGNAELSAVLEYEGPFDLVYERYALWSHAGMSYACRAGIPGLLEVNAPLIEEQARHRTLVDREAAEWVAGRAFSAASALLAVSSEVAVYLSRFPAAAGRVHVVPNGVNPGRFSPDRQPLSRTAPGSFTVGFVGTLKPWHGLPTLVEAFDLLHRVDPASQLLIVGDGPERPRLEAELARRALQDVTYLPGAVDPDDVPGWLASMDVAVAPYPDDPDFYFSPLKVYEYMAAGLPVVASDIGQLATCILHGENGLLCPPGDARSLAAALERLRRDPALRMRLGHEARATVLRDHTWKRVAGEILSLAGYDAPLPAALAGAGS